MQTIFTRMIRKISADMRGTISCGREIEGRAKKYKYFVIDDFSELQAAYGNEPDRMLILLPTNNIQEWFFSRKNEAVRIKEGDHKGKMFTRRFCDGDTCHFNIDMKVGGVPYEADCEYACICAANPELPDNEQCKMYTNLKAFVLHPVSGQVVHHMPYSFVNHSEHSTGNIFSEIEKISKITNGQLMGVPFILSVRWVEKPGKDKKSYPIWELQALGSLEMIQERAKAAVFPINAESAQLLLPGEIASTNLLSAGASIAERTEQILQATAPARAAAAPAEPKSRSVSIDQGALSLDGGNEQQRNSLISTLIEYRDEYYSADAVGFRNVIKIALKKNFDGKIEALNESELRVCIAKISQAVKPTN